MISPGLCSITFRALSVDGIIPLVVENGLAAIEWGGDIHVPAGRLDLAAAVGRRCAEAGLRTPSYGSYFRVTPQSDGSAFAAVVETARTLGAETVRVWADKKPSREMDADYFRRLADAGHILCEMAASAGCAVGFEYHPGTATDTNESAARLIRAIAHPAPGFTGNPARKRRHRIAWRDCGIARRSSRICMSSIGPANATPATPWQTARRIGKHISRAPLGCRATTAPIWSLSATIPWTHSFRTPLHYGGCWATPPRLDLGPYRPFAVYTRPKLLFGANSRQLWLTSKTFRTCRI